LRLYVSDLPVDDLATIALRVFSRAVNSRAMGTRMNGLELYVAAYCAVRLADEVLVKGRSPA